MAASTTYVDNVRHLEVTYPTWRSDPHYVYIGRRNIAYDLPQSIWHNPYPVSLHLTLPDVLELYELHVRQSGLLEYLHLLAGKTLVCWCHPKPCHGDILIRLLRERRTHAS